MACEWPVVALGNVAEFVNGDRGANYPKESDYREVGVSFISATDISTGTLNLCSTKKISPTAYERLRNGKISEGDLLFCLRGSIGKMALVAENGQGAIASSLVIIRGSDRADIRFIQYVLQSPLGKRLAISLDNGSVQPNISVRDLSRLEVSLPPLATQRDIVAFLRAFDDRIDNLRQTNATLEAIAQALFKSWFVDFDGVMPEDMQESELGLIPKGWQVASLDDAFEINPKRELKKGAVAPYLDMASVPTSGAVPDPPVMREFSSGTKFANGDTLLARITPCLENGKTAYVDFLDGAQTGWGSTEFIVLRPKHPLPAFFGYLLARREEFRSHAIRAMSGTSGRQRVEVGQLHKFMVAVPDESTGKAFGDVVHPLQKTLFENATRIETLASLRDTLLPRLISGRLRLPLSQCELAA